MTSSRHDPYELGYSCATLNVTKRSKNASWSKSLKTFTLYRLYSATWVYEGGIISNRKSAMLR